MDALTFCCPAAWVIIALLFSVLPKPFNIAAQIKFCEEHFKANVSLWPEIHHLLEVLQTILTFGDWVWRGCDIGQMET